MSVEPKEGYNIINDKYYVLKKTTARTEQELAKLGLQSGVALMEEQDFTSDETSPSDKRLQEILYAEDTKDLMALCNVIFINCKITGEAGLDLDKTVVREAVMDFFMRDLLLIGKYMNYSKSLSSQK